MEKVYAQFWYVSFHARWLFFVFRRKPKKSKRICGVQKMASVLFRTWRVHNYDATRQKQCLTSSIQTEYISSATTVKEKKDQRKRQRRHVRAALHSRTRPRSIRSLVKNAACLFTFGRFPSRQKVVARSALAAMSPNGRRCSVVNRDRVISRASRDVKRPRFQKTPVSR